MITKEQLNYIQSLDLSAFHKTPHEVILEKELEKYEKTKEFNIIKLGNEIIDSKCVENFKYVGESETYIFIYGDKLNNKTTLDNIITNHEFISLAEQKELRIIETDQNTVDIIHKGFTFSGQTFSLSTGAQTNLTNIKNSKAEFSTLNLFPLQMSTIDNKLYYLHEEDVDNMWIAGLGVVKYAYNSGGQLKQLIKGAKDLDELSNVKDNRK